MPSNFGQLRRNTDRKVTDRLAQFALATVFLPTTRLIDWRKSLESAMCPYPLKP